MKITTGPALLSLALSCAFAAHADASEMSYRMSIDGNSNMIQPQLAPGTHTLVVEAIVTDNVILGFDAGILQTSIDLSTDNGGFKFVDNMGGFLGGPDGLWDSDAIIPPFDARFNGITTLGGGPTVFEDVHFINPPNYNTKFQLIGANVWSVVAQGDFTYDADDTHPLHFNLTTTLAAVRVAGFDGVSQIISVIPDVLNVASISFIPEPSSLLLGAMASIGLMLRRRCLIG